MEVILDAKEKPRSEWDESTLSKMVEWELITEAERMEYGRALIKEVQGKCKDPTINKILECFMLDIQSVKGYGNVYRKIVALEIDYLPRNLFLLMCLLDHRGTKARMPECPKEEGNIWLSIFHAVSAKMKNLMPNKCCSCRKWYAVPHWVVPEVECVKCGRGRHDCKPPLQPRKNKKAIWLCSTCGYEGAVSIREKEGRLPVSRLCRQDKQTKLTRFLTGNKKRTDSTTDEDADEAEDKVMGNGSWSQRRMCTKKEEKKLPGCQVKGDDLNPNLWNDENRLNSSDNKNGLNSSDDENGLNSSDDENGLNSSDDDSSEFGEIPDDFDLLPSGKSESESDYDTDNYEYFRDCYAHEKWMRESQRNAACSGLASAQKAATSNSSSSSRINKPVGNTKDLPKFVRNARRKKGSKVANGNNKTYDSNAVHNPERGFARSIYDNDIRATRIENQAGSIYHSHIRGIQMKNNLGSTFDSHTRGTQFKNKNDEVVAVSPEEVAEAIEKVNIDSFLFGSESPMPFVAVVKSKETLAEPISKLSTAFLNKRTLVDDYTQATKMLLFKKL